MRFQAVASAFLVVFLCQHDVLVNGLGGLLNLGQQNPNGLLSGLTSNGQQNGGLLNVPNGLLPGLTSNVVALLEKVLGETNLQGLPTLQGTGILNCLLTNLGANNVGELPAKVQSLIEYLTKNGDQLITNLLGNDKNLNAADKGLLKCLATIVGTNNAGELAAKLNPIREALNQNKNELTSILANL
uniref:Harderian gland protein HG10 n=1 Tax=Thamnophis sirtalis TaxID=35019 RepID=A0A2H4WMB9_9SAUR|nr:harderian gland protein HG10 [Thamnophis sirtalis]